MTSASVRLDRGDLLLPTALGLAGAAEVLTVDEVPRSAALAMTVTACLLLIGRRRFPLMFATAACLIVVSGSWFGIRDDALVTPVAIVFTACFALGRYVATPWGLVGIGVINVSVHWSDGIDVPPVGDWLWVGALTLAPWIFGRLVQSHARSSELLADQAKQLVKEQGQIAERAVADERRRIARELHDVIAHSLSVMVVQAGAAREVLDTDSRTAGRALDEIQRAGRAALGETARLLDLLRDEPVSGVTPQPVAADLPRLVQDFRQSGLEVTLVLDGPTEGLPAGVDLSVFRVAEEGLTNALKHAPNGPVSVVYRRRAAAVDLQVKTTGSQTTGEFSSHGRGLIGMRERVAVFGGSLQAAQTSDGGFLVAAQLPVPQAT